MPPARIRQARRLDNNPNFPSAASAVDDAHKVAAHRATDAPIIHLEHFFIGIHHELIVDTTFAELIDDDGEFLAVRFGQNAVESSVVLPAPR